MEIPVVISNSKEQVEIKNLNKKLWEMTIEEMIKNLGLKQEVIDWHYIVEQRYHEVGDLYSDELVNYVSELLYDYAQADNLPYVRWARGIVERLRDELIETIFEQDDNAKDSYETLMSARGY